MIMAINNPGSWPSTLKGKERGLQPVEPSLCYLAGALRDGSILVRRGHDYEIKILQNNLEWLLFLNDLIKTLFNVKGSINVERRSLRRYYVLRIYNKKLVELLLRMLNYKAGRKQSSWDTPLIVKESSIECVKMYIRGFFDSEGGLPKYPEKFNYMYISFDQKNKESLEFIRNELIKLGFKPTNITYTGKVWQFRITRYKDILKFFTEIGSSHQDKKIRLEKMIIKIKQKLNTNN